MSPMSVISRVQFIVVNPLSHEISIGETITTIFIQRLDK